MSTTKSVIKIGRNKVMFSQGNTSFIGTLSLFLSYICCMTFRRKVSLLQSFWSAISMKIKGDDKKHMYVITSSPLLLATNVYFWRGFVLYQCICPQTLISIYTEWICVHTTRSNDKLKKELFVSSAWSYSANLISKRQAGA